MATSKRYNVLFLEIGLAQGGSSNFLYHRIKQMNRSLFNPTIAFYYENEGPDLKKLKQLEAPILFLTSSGNWNQDSSLGLSGASERSRVSKKIRTIFKVIYESWLQLKVFVAISRTIHKHRIHLVVLNNDIHYHGPGILAAKFCRKPIICRKAGIGNGGRIARWLVPLVDLIVAISRAAQRDALAFGINPERLIWRYEGIDLSDYRPEAWHAQQLQIREKFHIAPESFVIGAASRLTPTKGQEELIAAASLVANTNDHLIFLIVGDDEDPAHRYRHSLERQVARLRLERQLKFVGWYENIPEILSIMDVFIQNPTYPEGLGIANLEAMAMAKPTIVTDMGGLSETTVHEKTGIILQSNDPADLAAAIDRLIRNKQLMVQMGQQGRKRIAMMFDLSKNIREIDRIFYRVASGNFRSAAPGCAAACDP